MAANSGASLRVRVSADLADIKQGLGVLRGELTRMRDQASKTAPDFSAWSSGLRSVRSQIVGLVSAWASVSGAKVLGAMADEATQLRGRIQAAKGDYQAILAVANETRSGLMATVDLYARLERGTRGQGLGQERLLNLTRSVNQAIRLSFTSTAAGEAAVMQFGQALASGALRGDELNSVLEQTPRLAEAVAAGMGIEVGKLKELAKQGKLTAAEVIKAVESQGAALATEFSAMPKTIGDAMTQLRNAFLDYVGDVDSSTGASRRFAAAIESIAADLPKYLDPLLKIAAALVENFDTLAVAVGTYFGIQAVASAVVGIQKLIAGFVSLRAMILATEVSAKGLRVTLATMGGPITLAIAAVTAAIFYLYQRSQDAKQAQDEHNRALEDFNRLASVSRDEARKLAEEQRKLALRTVQAAQASLEEQRVRLAASRSTTARGGDRGDAEALAASNAYSAAEARLAQAESNFREWGSKLVKLAMDASDEVLASAADAVTPPGGDPVKPIAASNALLRDSVGRAIAELERLYAAHEVGLKDYFAERQRLQEQAIDLEIQQARNEMAVTKDAGQRRNLEEQIVKLQRDRAELGATTAREQAAAEADLAKQLEAVKMELLELDGKSGEAARIRLEQEYKDLFKRLEAASDESGKAIVRNLIERNVTKAQLDDFRTRASEILGGLQSTEGSVSAQVDARTLGAAEGERRLQAVRAKSLEQLVALRDAVAAFYEKTKDPSVRAFLTSLDGNIADVTMSMQEFRMKMEDQAESSFGQFISDLVDGTKTFKEAFADMVRSFAAGVAQMIAQELALRAIRAALSAFGGASGSAPAAHGGGVAGRLQMTRNNINPMVFGHAPRYHGGGVAGLANNEIPAILERGETIRTKQQEAALTAQLDAARSGGRQGMVTTPIVAIGDSAVADALAGAAGENVVLTHVRNNWDRLSRGR